MLNPGTHISRLRIGTLWPCFSALGIKGRFDQDRGGQRFLEPHIAIYFLRSKSGKQARVYPSP
jgi:hypothetical protein